MDVFDNEAEIIEHFQYVQSSSVMLFPEQDEECEKVFQAVNKEKEWKKWINSSGKADPPPTWARHVALRASLPRRSNAEYVLLPSESPHS